MVVKDKHTFPAFMQQSRVCFRVCSGGVEDPEGVCVGDREGNRWLQYDSSSLPLSEEQWDCQQYVEKTHWGYYTWPRYHERSGEAETETLRLINRSAGQS